MKKSVIMGVLAAVLAAVIPLLFCGMGKNPAAEAVASPEAVPSEQPAEEAERKVTEILIHQSGGPSDAVDESLTLTVEVDGEDVSMSLRDYLTGVLLGEVPASFEFEALKAQAVAARTYTLHRLAGGGTLSDDPAECQAFVSPETAEEALGDDWEELLSRLRSAVEETDGEVLTYDGELISATYFSSAGGRTESAAAVWGSDIPYLQSVESQEETEETGITVPLAEFLSALEIDSPGVSDITYTDGGGVDTMVIGGKTVTGTALRALFGLNSTRFSMEITQDAVEFTVQGHGHRVGLSQYGAQAMAQAGKGYEEILLWYYTGVTLEKYSGSV